MAGSSDTYDIQETIRKVLLGQPGVPIEIDFKPKEATTSFIPVCKRNVGYIVCGVAINAEGGHGEVLMMQEAKSSCYGEWYLPAGRMEPGETLREAASREVLEETGLEFEPTSLIMVEGAPTWYRFTFVGNITGGRLKTLEEKDSESLCAKWSTLDEIFLGKLKLRGKDILPLIETAVRYKNLSADNRHAHLLPEEISLKYITFRCMYFVIDSSGDNVKTVINMNGQPHIPGFIIRENHHSLIQSLEWSLSYIFPIEDKRHKPYVKDPFVVLGLTHNGKPKDGADGLCLTVMCELQGFCDEDGLLELAKGFRWISIEIESIRNEIIKRMKPNEGVPLVIL